LLSRLSRDFESEQERFANTRVDPHQEGQRTTLRGEQAAGNRRSVSWQEIRSRKNVNV
jgi:hypothetical protein